MELKIGHWGCIGMRAGVLEEGNEEEEGGGRGEVGFEMFLQGMVG